MIKKIVIGLGNPGLKYRETRHNMGFLLADMLAGDFYEAGSCFSLIAEGEEFVTVKPLTYMNRSGLAVKKISEKFEINTDSLLIAYDDFNIPRGKLRIRPSGSAGGHNGMQSVIDALGTSKIPRLRMGIGGAAVTDKVSYVLENFGEREFKEISDMLIEAKRLVYFYIKNGMAAAMDRYN